MALTHRRYLRALVHSLFFPSFDTGNNLLRRTRAMQAVFIDLLGRLAASMVHVVVNLVARTEYYQNPVHIL